MTITPELIEEVARRMCVAQEQDPDERRTGFPKTPNWRRNWGAARDAIAARIALDEIMPPDRATLLAVADATKEVARNELHLGRAQGAWLKFAAALRAKAVEAGE